MRECIIQMDWAHYQRQARGVDRMDGLRKKWCHSVDYTTSWRQSHGQAISYFNLSNIFFIEFVTKANNPSQALFSPSQPQLFTFTGCFSHLAGCVRKQLYKSRETSKGVSHYNEHSYEEINSQSKVNARSVIECCIPINGIWQLCVFLCQL